MVMSIKEKNERLRSYRNEWNKKKSKELNRNEYGLTKREETKIYRIVMMLILLDRGYKCYEIAEELGVSNQCISKIRRQYNKFELDKKVHREIEKRYKALSKELKSSRL